MTKFSDVIEDLIEKVSTESRTGKLWLNYVKFVYIIKLFLYAERTGNWELHLHCISQMIPLFHAAGHLAYAKSARLYLHQMQNLEEIMSDDVHRNFTERGFFTVRHSDHF